MCFIPFTAIAHLGRISDNNDMRTQPPGSNLRHRGNLLDHETSEGGIVLRGIRRAIAAVLVILVIAAAVTGCGSKDKLRIGTAGEGGNYSSMGHALSDVLAQEPYKIETEVKTTAGSASNIRLLSQNYLELALAQSDVIDEMYHGTLDTQAIGGYSAIAALYPEAVQIVVRADSQIATVSDLAGKTVSVGEADSGTQRNAAQILQVYGLTSNMLTVQNMTYTEAVNALRSGTIDAMFCTAGVPAQVITDLSKEMPVNLVPVKGQQAALLKDAYGFYTKVDIPAGTYNGQKNDVTTLAVQSVLLASDKVPEDTIHTITSALFREKTVLNEAVPVEFDLQEESAVESITIPFHPGAAKYYGEHGITVEHAGE